jgi:hypothetical protein
MEVHMKHKRRFLCFAMLLAAVTVSSLAQVAGDFRSVAGLPAGSLWSAVATWETYNGSAWAAATTLPTATANVTVVNGDTLTLDISDTVKTLTISSNGRVNPYSVTLGGNIIVNGALALSGTSLSVSGNVTVSGSNASVNFSNTSSKMNFVGTGQTLTITNGATFQQVATASGPPWSSTGSLTGTYTLVVDNSSAKTTIVYKTQGNYTLSNLPNGQTFGNIKFTSAANSTAIVTLGNDLSITGSISIASTTPNAMTWNLGSFKITSTGNGTFVDTSTTANHLITGTGTDLFTGFSSFSFVPYSGTCTVTYAGANQKVLGGAYQNLTIAGSGNMPLTGPATVGGTLTLTSGNLDNSVYQVTVSGSIVKTGGTTSRNPVMTSVEEANSSAPNRFTLNQNYPNPFNPSTAISYQLSAKSFVSLRIFDVLGREVAVLVNGQKPAGTHTVAWNALNVPSGVYVCRLEARTTSGDSYVETRKMLLTK